MPSIQWDTKTETWVKRCSCSICYKKIYTVKADNSHDAIERMNKFFYWGTCADGLSSSCKECMVDKRALRGSSNRQAMLKKQNYLCAICNERVDRGKACIDHNHETGTIRGILCNRCNVGLHYLENEAWKAKAMEYLDEDNRHSKCQT